MQTVFKYDIPHEDECQIDMPAGAELLSVGCQIDGLKLWARVDPRAPFETRVFKLRGTGHEIEESCAYVGTMFEGPFVWHLFEENLWQVSL